MDPTQPPKIPGYVFWTNVSESDMYTRESLQAEEAAEFDVDIDDVRVEPFHVEGWDIQWAVYLRDRHRGLVDAMHETIRQVMGIDTVH